MNESFTRNAALAPTLEHNEVIGARACGVAEPYRYKEL